MSRHPRSALAVVILAAGKGKRMKSDLPKVVFDLAGWPLIRHVLAAAAPLSAKKTIAVIGHGRRLVETALAGLDAETVLQREQKGTGHAVKCAERALKGFAGDVLVLLGDVPLVCPATLKKLLATHRRRKAALTILTADAPDPRGYGRVLRDGKGRVEAIREEKDATARERAVREINTGMMVFRADALWPSLRKLKADNSQGEYYLTDVPGILIGKGERVLKYGQTIGFATMSRASTPSRTWRASPAPRGRGSSVTTWRWASASSIPLRSTSTVAFGSAWAPPSSPSPSSPATW